MKNNSTNTSEVRAEQVTSAAVTSATGPNGHAAIYLGVDMHKESLTVTRIIDHATPEPAQRFTWEQFWRYIEKQTALAQKVFAVYEAGAFGFWPARRMKSLGIQAHVAHPEKLDPRHKRVQTDKLDSRHLADRLQRYALGNTKAMVSVYVPSPEEEQQRLLARHYRKLQQQVQTLRARGRGLLLSQGIFNNQRWWQDSAWEPLQGKLGSELAAILADHRQTMAELERQLDRVQGQLEAAAPKALPKGFGKLTFVLLLRQLCNYRRFGSRRNVAGFTGLCGAVSSSGPYHAELSINKSGDPYLRTLLIELAWRMIYWQPGYKGLKVYQRLREGGVKQLLNKRRRKIAVVAVARQLGVDLWRWQTGRVTPEQLGWQMSHG